MDAHFKKFPHYYKWDEFINIVGLIYRGCELEVVIRVDKRGRIVIPKDLRDQIGLGRLARLKVEGKRIVIEPIENPLQRLKKTVKVRISDIEGELRELREKAEDRLREVSERWR